MNKKTLWREFNYAYARFIGGYTSAAFALRQFDFQVFLNKEEIDFGLGLHLPSGLVIKKYSVSPSCKTVTLKIQESNHASSFTEVKFSLHNLSSMFASRESFRRCNDSHVHISDGLLISVCLRCLCGSASIKVYKLLDRFNKHI